MNLNEKKSKIIFHPCFKRVKFFIELENEEKLKQGVEIKSLDGYKLGSFLENIK